MRLFLYYASHAFFNQIRKLCKTWVLILIIVCVAIGALTGVLSAVILSDDYTDYEVELDANGQPTGYLIDEYGEYYIDVCDLLEETAALEKDYYSAFELQSRDDLVGSEGQTLVEDTSITGVVRDANQAAYVLVYDTVGRWYAVPFADYYYYENAYDDFLDHDEEYDRYCLTCPDYDPERYAELAKEGLTTDAGAAVTETAEETTEESGWNTESVEDPDLLDQEADGGIFAGVGSVLEELGESYDTGAIAESIAFLGALIFLFYFLFTAESFTGKMFLMGDVNYLFSSSMKPQSVLLFRLLNKLGGLLIMCLYFGVLYLPELMDALKLGAGSMMILILGFFILLGYCTLSRVLVYCLASGRKNFWKKLQFFCFGVLALLLAGFSVYWKLGSESPAAAAVGLLSRKALRLVPVLGWFKALVGMALNADLAGAALWIALLVAGMAAFVALIWSVKTDFYEDAMAKSEEVAELQRQTQETGNAFATGKRKHKAKKKRRLFKSGQPEAENNEDEREYSLRHGNGASVFFFRLMYSRWRFGFLHYFTNTTWFYLGSVLLVTVFGHLVFHEAIFLPCILLLALFSFYRCLGNPISEDVKMNLFRMIPESSFRKLGFSLLGSMTNAFLDLLPALLLVGIAAQPEMAALLVWTVFLLTLNLFATIVGAFMDVTIPIEGGATIKQTIQVLFMYFGLIPDALILLAGIWNDNILPYAGAAAFVNLILTTIFLLLTASKLEPEEGQLRTFTGHCVNRRAIRKTFSRLGWAAVVWYASASIFQLVLAAIAAAVAPWLLQGTWVYLFSFLPLYLFGLPLGLLVLRKLPVLNLNEGWKRKFSFGEMLRFFFIMVALAYIGSLLGSLISTILTVLFGSGDSDVVGDLLSTGTLAVQTLFICIIGPMVEEFFFRKILIDRARAYGEKNAILFSALMFGMFHGNITQFLYASILGVVLGYVYVRSNKLRYSIALHMAYNFMGGIFPTIVNLLMDKNMEALQLADDLTWSQLIPQLEKAVASQGIAAISGFVLYGVYLLYIVLAFIIGIILFLLSRKKIRLYETPQQLPDAESARITWLNPGMIAFTILMVAMMIMSILTS